MNSPLLTLCIAFAVALLCALGEWLHARRVRRIALLAFGPAGSPRRWTRGIPVARILGCGLAAWGLLTLLAIDGTPADLTKGKPPDRHLILALDVSPSMYLADSGPDAKHTRRQRAAEVMQSILDRIDLTRTRVSIVAFYSTARPVVTDTFDLAVVNNIINDLPLAQAFKEGQTDMYAGVREAIKLAQRWQPGSTTLAVISDGDTLPEAGLPALPAAIADVLVIGVGNPYRGTEIAGKASKQDASALKHLAARLRGLYHDGNAKHLPSDVLRSLNMLTLREDQAPQLRTFALIALTVGGACLALVSPLLAMFGAPVPAPSRRRGRNAPVTPPTAIPSPAPELIAAS